MRHIIITLGIVAFASACSSSGVDDPTSTSTAESAQDLSSTKKCPAGEKICTVARANGTCHDVCVPLGAMCVAPRCKPVCDPAGPRPNPACSWNLQTCQWDCPVCDPAGPRPQPSCQWDSQHCVWLCL